MLPERVSLKTVSTPSAIPFASPGATNGILDFSFVVLNLNGAAILREFFETIDQCETNRSFEIIIVDHGSTDESFAVCEQYNYLNVRLFPRGRNFSFSESNNFGAHQSNGQYIICLNNDIFWCQPILDLVKQSFSDEDVGCVGIQLLDSPAENCELAPPVVQTIGIHFNMHLKDRAIHPVETRYDSSLNRSYFDSSNVPGVTGAFLVMRAKDFLLIGGFDEAYNYGYEDVDLCLKVRFQLGKRVVVQNLARAFHHRGYSRKKSGKWAGSNMVRNRAQLEQNFAFMLRRDLLNNILTGGLFWQGRPLTIAFAVTEATNDTPAGDFFTAAEFGDALQRRFGASIVFLEEKKNWYDVHGVDILFAMRHEYDLKKLVNKKSTLVTVGWARNWFEKWADRELTSDYNIVAASGGEAVLYLEMKLHRPILKLDIATNARRFSMGETVPRVDDVVFTGNFWGHPREVGYMFRPEIFSGTFRAYGAGWEKVDHWAAYSAGLKQYSEMPDLYRRAKIVLDDANSVTKAWGSVNSRVYDALAAGCLVVTNGVKGSKSEFDGRLPTYSSSHELHDLLNMYLGDPELFESRASELRELVLSRHTYDHRADEFARELPTRISGQRRFAIKIGAPNKSVVHEWGDFHFAECLKYALVELGHTARIDCLDAWDSSEGYGDDCVIVLRGLNAYKTKSYQCNIMWIISHPDMISIAEFRGYDLVFTASGKHQEHLSAQGVHAETLLQCTDPARFNLDAEAASGTGDRPLFVGNTRNVYRPVVRFCIESGMDLDVIGAGWRDFIPSSYVIADNVKNTEVAHLYRSASFVLNDHWESMREWGFISNRVFDVVACGVPCLSDYVEGITDIFGDAVVTFKGKEDFGQAVAQAEGLRHQRELLVKASAEICRNHSFSSRASHIVDRYWNWEGSKTVMSQAKADLPDAKLGSVLMSRG